MSLTTAQRKALHHCPCGHLIESHDFAGCFQADENFSPCYCEETFEGQLFTTTYAVVADLLAAETARADKAEAERDVANDALTIAPEILRLAEMSNQVDAWKARAERAEADQAEADRLRAELIAEVGRLTAERDEYSMELGDALAEVARLSGPFACCPHCADDPIHAVDLNQHSVECRTCGSVADKRAERAEAALGRCRELAEGWECPPHYRKHDAEAAAGGFLTHLNLCLGCSRSAELTRAIDGEA